MFVELYREQFADQGYATKDDAHRRFDWAISMVPKGTIRLLDVGAGRGRFLERLESDRVEAMVCSCDLDRFHDEPYAFFRCDLTTRQGRAGLGTDAWDVITCLDVLEHLPESMVLPALRALRRAARTVIVTAANHPEPGIGGVELHLTQQPYNWWETKLREAGLTFTAKATLWKDRGWGWRCERVSHAE